MKSKVHFESSNSRLMLLVALIALTLPFVIWSSVSGQGRRPVRPIQPGVTTDGLKFRLSEGTEGADRRETLPTPQTSPLNDDAVNNLLRRLPQIKTEPDDQSGFAMRDRSLPPPKTGQTINSAFPPADSGEKPEPTASGALEVVRFAPEGELGLAPHLTVTFSQPMVAVTSIADLAASQIPVKLTPQPKGKWRWLGTKTLIFEPEGRFPMATDYSVEVPAGTKSAMGNALAAAKRWTFATPPVKVKSSYPTGGPHHRNPVMFIEFDQRIDPVKMLKAIQLTAGAVSWKLRLASTEEIASDDVASRFVKSAEPNRWLAFRALPMIGANAGQPLPAGTSFTVTIPAGAPSAEGSRVTTEAQKFTFRTYDALQLTEARCGWGDGCRPFTPFQFVFNNPLDAKAFQQTIVKVAPAIEGMKVAVYGNSIQISGATKGRTTYTVTIDAALRDVFGQTLGKAITRSFAVGDAYPMLSANGNGFVVLDPNGPPRFSIYTINQPSVKVRLFAVTVDQWRAYQQFLQTRGQRGQSQTPPGELVKSQTVTINGQNDELTETAIDLSQALKNNLGHVILTIEPTVKRRDWEQEIILWVQATQIGLDAFADQTDLVGWATSLKDGKPIAGAQVELLGGVGTESGNQAKATTAADGLAKFALPASGSQKMLVARQGSDVAFLPESPYWWEGAQSAWNRRSVQDSLLWHVFDDRAMYRPSEEVNIKGWLRRIGGGKLGDVGLAAGARVVSYVLRDSRGNEVLKGTAQINALGGFNAAFKLPPTMNLGYATLALFTDGDLPGNSHQHGLQVQEFRRPEYEVKVSASNGPHLIQGSATVTAAASYYAGGALSNAETQWNVTATPTNYTPPNRGDFNFGTWTPWWWYDRPSGASASQTFAGRTDAAGKHNLRIDFDSVSPIRATSISAQATVQDVNRQAIAGSTSFIVHPSELYVGIRSPRMFVQKGEPLVVETIATDIDGKLIVGREIRMRAVLIDWAFENGEWKERETAPQDCVVRSGNAAVQCSFRTNEGGRYRVTASIFDDRERRNESQMTLWVAGGKTEPQRDVAQEKVELIPDRQEYESDQTAQILVQAPFFPAEGVVTLRRSGLVSTERFTMNSASHTLKIPINEAYVPNIHVQVDLVGAAIRTDDAGNAKPSLPRRPAFASGELNLTVPPLKRKLTVTATPRDKALEPGGETAVDVELRDATGKPVAGAEVAVVVVDEAVLALSNYKLADPLATFYTERSGEVSNYHLRQNVVLAKPDNLIGQLQGGMDRASLIARAQLSVPPPMASPQPEAAVEFRAMAKSASGDAAAQPQPIRARIDFNALATFAPALPTDASGRASVKVKVPDNLTRYRVMAVAVAGEKQFGSGESAITARLPLMARPSAPRFLNFGDRFELPVVVQNQTDNPMTVDVAVRASNAEFLSSEFRLQAVGNSADPSQPPKGGILNVTGRRVTVPANDRVEVRFPTTTSKPGTARFQIAVASGKWADAAEVNLPVWTPATTEAFATYGEVDAGAIIQPVKAPSDAFRQFGGLEITTSSTQLQALTDAVIYLANYPYDCAEQVSSRVLAIAALKDVLGAFDAKGLPSAETLIASVSRDMERLKTLQNGDGGFGFWRNGEESWPYVSIHAAHAMQRAKEKGFAVPPEMLQKSQSYLKQIESKFPSYYSVEARRVLTAYALNVRNRMGDRDAAKARALIAQAGGVEKLPLEALGWLLPVLTGETEATAIRRHLNNRAEETAGTAHFTTSYSDGAHLLLHSNRRADGIILESLIGDDPKNDLIPKIVRGLLAHRVKGRWENTQENAFILLALDRYFQVYEKATPNFVARAWLGDGLAGSHEYRGRTTDSHQINVPMSYLMSSAMPQTQNLVLGKEGAGRLYYRIGMNYAPTSLQLRPYDAGFTVSRSYEAVDDPNDVRRLEDGSWRIKAGARVRVRLTMYAASRRYHVALVDPMPAGFEALNPALAVTGNLPRDDKDVNARGWWWSWQWFQHQNMRDERVEAFTTFLWEGVYNYSYLARATTPGNFVVPPTKAEEMYHPETFGRSASERVVIE